MTEQPVTETEPVEEQEVEVPAEGDTAEGMSDDDRAKGMRQAYTAATARLREEHRSEFDSLYSQECEARGITYTPRLTPEQKAQQQLEQLLAEHPHLRETLTQ